ncbi:MAG: hypothetical protein KIT84_17825 [Labilithrix sp.]|nr:hypothetical protein [Labilithrix sp.]MCW5812893.1 hypothetical protein [Labilithrix sp.]
MTLEMLEAMVEQQDCELDAARANLEDFVTENPNARFEIPASFLAEVERVSLPRISAGVSTFNFALRA